MSEILYSEMQAQAEQAAIFLKSLAHPTRLMIACSLVDEELAVGELHQQFSNVSQSAFSQQLAVLRKNDIVTTRRESQTIFYSLKNDHVKQLIGALRAIYC